MIKNFDSFIKDNNYYHGGISTEYKGDLWSTLDLQGKIQKYFFEKYPHKVTLLNRTGMIKSVTLDRLIKFANKRNDEKLLDLIQKFLDRIEEIRIEKTASKYNI